MEGNVQGTKLFLEFLSFGALLLSIFIINEIVRTEKVTDFNSYAMLFFVLLLIAFPNTMMDGNAIFCNFFLLLAIWRIVSVRSLRNVKHKVFDASFLIGAASLFYDWALLFLIPVFVIINVYDRKTFKNWLVPFVALITVFILSFTLLKLTGYLAFFEEHYQFTTDIFSDWSLQLSSTKFLMYTLLFFVIMFFVFLRTRKIGGGKLVLLRIIFFIFILGFGICIFKWKNSSLILLTFFPAAIFLANYVEGIRKPKFRELVLALGIAIPILLFVLEHKP
nr:DUF6427 family protein [Allomuricauda amphidinii]